MLVRVEKAQGYGYIARPNSERTAETMRLDMIENGAGGPGCTQWLKPDDVVAEIYLQEFSDVESELGDYIGRRNLEYLNQGYPIDIKVPKWDFRQMLGYSVR